MDRQIQSLIEHLALASVAEDARNPYAFSGDPAGNAIRRDNLALYFEEILAFGPTLMLVGEAPGYRGCRVTGIPFTSETIMMKGVAGNAGEGSFTLLGEEKGYRSAGGDNRWISEASATIIWQGIGALKTPPLLWNVYPFHPHRRGNPESNRRPRVGEIAFGMTILRQVSAIFGIRKVAAVGKVASAALADAHPSLNSLRHPAHGGKKQFLEQLNRLVGSA